MFRKYSVIMALLLMAVPTFAFAEAFNVEDCAELPKNEINTVEQLKEAINNTYENDGKMTKAEAKTVIEEASPNVLIDFFEEKMNDADIAIENADIDVDQIINDGANGCGKVIMDIGDHSEVILEFEDKDDPTVIESIKNTLITPAYAATNGETMWKSYGNRYFTAKKTVLSGIGGAVIKLENHYKVSANGLDERYGDAYVEFSFSAGITGNISANNPVISDSSARTPGKSNINMYARYPYHFDGQGIAASGGTYKMTTAVDYLKKDSTNKRIQVKHRWSVQQ